jgi:hypothetical protein
MLPQTHAASARRPNPEQLAALVSQYLGPAVVKAFMDMYPDPHAAMWTQLHQKAAELLEPAAEGQWKDPRRYEEGQALQAKLEALERGDGPTPAPISGGSTLPVDAEAYEDAKKWLRSLDQPKPEPVAPSQAMTEARARSKMGAKGATQARASRVKATQQKAVARAKGSEPTYQEGGWYKMPNLSLDLIGVMPGPVVKAYLVACRLANGSGDFEIGHQRLAEWIGGETRQHGERAMRRLVDAGLVKQRWRGGPGRVNGYRLASLARLDFETAKATLSLPLTESGGEKHTRRLLEHATAAVASP